MTPPVYVVLVNYKRWADTIECLESVLRSDYPDTRVIVVDNDAADVSMRMLQDWANGTHVVEPAPNQSMRHLSWPPLPKPIACLTVKWDKTNPARKLERLTLVSSDRNLGFAGATNVALQLLLDGNEQGYVCMINNDMVVAPDAISALVAAIQRDGGIGAVGGVVLDYFRPDVVETVGGGRMSRLGMSSLFDAGSSRALVRKPNALGYVSGGCMLIGLETVRRVGGMDERYFLYADDADWGERLRAAGCTLDCTLDAVVWHKGSQTTGARTPLQDYYVVRSALMFVRKHAVTFLPLAAAYSVVRMLAPKLVRGQWARAWAVLRAYADFVRDR